MSRTNTPLALVDIKEIMAELAQRYETMVFAGASGYDEDHVSEYSFLSGSLSLGLGLAARLTYQLNIEQADSMQSLDD